MHPNLSFEQAPPLSVPLRFFLTAPLFGIAAGLLLLWQGSEMLASRWMPAALAGTHLITAGFMLQAMCGALMQFIPVAAGGNIWRPRLVAAIVHPLLAVSAALLTVALLGGRAVLFQIAAHGFALALAIYLLAAGAALWRTAARGASIIALRISLFGLLVTLVLGVILATGLARGSDLPRLPLTDIHAAWGLGGWALMLLAGVAYYVVPMFQLTPPYPPLLARGFPWMLLVILLLMTPRLSGFSDASVSGLLLTALGVAGMFAAETLHLQSRRRRRVSDTTLLFFRTAMISLLTVLLSVLLFATLPALRDDPHATVWLGVLALVGVFVSAINGMLYKIVPFLIWLHLQRLGGLHTLPPTMDQMIPARAMRRQHVVHMAALLLLLLSVWLPVLARPAGLLFAIDCAWLGANLVTAVRAYLLFKNRIPVGG